MCPCGTTLAPARPEFTLANAITKGDCERLNAEAAKDAKKNRYFLAAFAAFAFHDDGCVADILRLRCLDGAD